MANEIKGIRVNGVSYKVNYPDLSNKIAGDMKRVNIFPAQDVTFHQDGGEYATDDVILDCDFTPNDRQTAIITLNNKEYPCVVSDGIFWIETDGGHLTAFLSNYGSTFYCNFASDMPGNKNIKIDLVYYSTMDASYLPYLHQFGGIGEPSAVVRQQTVTFNGGVNTSTIDYVHPIMQDYDDSHNEYIVTWDGIPFYCRAVYNGNDVYLVNEYDPYGNSSADSLPFYIAYSGDNNNYTVAIKRAGQETHELKIDGRIIFRMSSALLPWVVDENNRGYTLIEALNEICSQAGLSLTFHDEYYGNN